MSDPQSNPEPASARPQSDEPFAAPVAQPSAEQRPEAPAAPAPGPAPSARPAEATTAQFPSTPHYTPQTGGYPYGQQAYGQPVSGQPVTGQPMSAQPGSPAGTWTPPGGMVMPGSPYVAPRKKSPVLKIVAGVAAAGLIALCSAGAGGIAGAALVDKHPVTTTTINAAPAIDRASLADIAAAVSPSVVSITTETGEGSGVVMSADGYILTNNHVVATAQSNTMRVAFTDGSRASATVVGTDPRYDLAVIKADKTGLTAAKFGKSADVRVGDTVLAIGSPLGLEGSVTEGIISAEDRTIRVQNSSMSGLLQTDAPINPGNSGGALVNTKGEVIGINSSIATDGSSQGNIGIGFAIPSDRATSVAQQLIKGETVSHPALGVQAIDSPAGGATVAKVIAGGAAEKAGLQEGDVITKFGDATINGADDLVSAVQSRKVGDKVEVTFKRGGNTQTATVTLAQAS
jgi:putative serine protease PepD